MSRNWLYTAVTRATHLKNVKFFSHETAQNDDDYITKYFIDKIKGYVLQDQRDNRTIEDNYINVERLSKCIGKKCGRCQNHLYCDVDNNNVDCNVTAQRIDNTVGHNIDNIIPYCVYCNVSQSNR